MEVRQLITAFILDRRSSGYSIKTLDWHEVSLAMFADWLETQSVSSASDSESRKIEAQGVSDPDAWSPTLIRQYIVHLQTRHTARGKPLSGASVNSYVGSVLAFLRFLYAEELIEKDIAARVKKPARPKLIKRPFSEAEIHILLSTAKATHQGLRDYAIFCTLLDCGIRAAELVALALDDVVLNQQIVIVRQGKGAKDRVVIMSVDTAKAINKYILKGRHTDSDILFVTHAGEPLLPNAVRLLVQRLAKKAGVQGATAHRFRRTFATSFLRNGGNIYDLQQLMGHTDISITTGYLYANEEDLKRSHDSASPLSNLKRRK